MARRASTRAEYERIWTAANDYIKANSTKQIIIDDFCKAAHVSRRSAQRVFAVYGTGWRSMLRRTRLNSASHLLLHSDAAVKDIARKVGYRQQAQFARAFQRQFGLTPSRYREAFSLKARTGATS